jgi:hypothetical protein
MVERLLSMQEAQGSIPCFSTLFFLALPFSLHSLFGMQLDSSARSDSRPYCLMSLCPCGLVNEALASLRGGRGLDCFAVCRWIEVCVGLGWWAVCMPSRLSSVR